MFLSRTYAPFHHDIEGLNRREKQSKYQRDKQLTFGTLNRSRPLNAGTRQLRLKTTTTKKKSLHERQ